MKRKPLWSTLIVTLMLISVTAFAQEIWKDSKGKENGWKHHASFGWFWSESRSSMQINHSDHGLMHAAGSFEKGVWLHDSELGWIWTSRAEYPNLFSTTRGSWLFYIVGSKYPRIFYDYEMRRWTEIQGGGMRYAPGEVLVGIVNEIEEQDLMRFFKLNLIKWRSFSFPQTVSIWIESEREIESVIAELGMLDLVRDANSRAGRILVRFNIVGSLGGTIVEVNRFLSGLDQVKIASDYIYSSPLIVLVTLPGNEFQLINWLTDLSFVKSATLNVFVFAANEAAQTTKDMLFSF